MPRAYRTFLTFILLLTGGISLAGCETIEHWGDKPPAPTAVPDAPTYCYRSLGRVQCYPTAQPESTVGSFVGTQQPPAQIMQVIHNPDGTETAVETDPPAAKSPSWPMPSHP